MIRKIKSLLKKLLLNFLRKFSFSIGAKKANVPIDIGSFITILVAFSPAGFTFATYITFIQQSRIFFHCDSFRIIYLYHFIFIFATLFVTFTILGFLGKLFLFFNEITYLAGNQPSSSNNRNALPLIILLEPFKKCFTSGFLIIWSSFAALYFISISLFNDVKDVFNFRQFSSNWISVLFFFILLILKVAVVIVPVLYLRAVDYLSYIMQEEDLSSL